MKNSKDRSTQYCVIVRPRYREHQPMCYIGYAKDKIEAASAVLNAEWHKEILDVVKTTDIVWNKNTMKKYWELYGIYNNKINICAPVLF